MKMSQTAVASLSADVRNKALNNIAEALSDNRDKIFDANCRDLARADADGVGAAVKKRLRFDESKLAAVTDGLKSLAGLSDPIGRVTLRRELDDGLLLERVTCPIGVIGVIFEARPDALVQISSLCLKSGNCAILKGGRETKDTNAVLFEIIHDAAIKSGFPDMCLFQVTEHEEIDELLSCDGDVDLIIPRGSNAFVRYIMDNTRIPVMGHADGICHVYVDASADIEKAIPILLDAKLQYTAACNAVETVLIHRDIADGFLPKLAEAYRNEGVELHATGEAAQTILRSDSFGAGEKSVRVIGEDDFHTEYLDRKISIKLVSDVKEAVSHINRYGSHHTDACLCEDDGVWEYFAAMTDSAGVYRNCSTRFADGFRYGFGAEVGISTSKLHARGPVGLEGLVTYKYRLTGSGQIVGDYADGKKEFHFKDLI